MSAGVREVMPSTFDSFTVHGRAESAIALHVYEVAEGGRETVTHVVTLSPDRALEMVQELVTALSFTALPKGQIIDTVADALAGES